MDWLVENLRLEAWRELPSSGAAAARAADAAAARAADAHVFFAGVPVLGDVAPGVMPLGAQKK